MREYGNGIQNVNEDINKDTNINKNTNKTTSKATNKTTNEPVNSSRLHLRAMLPPKVSLRAMLPSKAALRAAAAASAAAVIALAVTFPASAAGWTQEGSRWKWYSTKGEYASKTWKKWDDGTARWLDDTGFMVTSNWVREEGNYYYVDEDGRQLTNTWAELPPPEQVKGSGDLGTFWYYFGNTGRMADDRIIETDGFKYYVGQDGKRQYGWIMDGVSYADEDGILVTDWQELKGPDGETHQYYFGPNGKKTRASDGAMYRTREIGGTDYCFDTEGIMQTGWVDLAAPAGAETALAGADTASAGADTTAGKTDTASAGAGTTAAKTGAASAEAETSAKTGTGTAAASKAASQASHTPDWRFYDEDGAAASGRVIIREADGTQQSLYFRKNGIGMTGTYDDRLYYEGMLQQAAAGSGYRVVSVPQKEQGKFINYLVDTKGNVVKKGKVRSKNGVRYETDAAGRVRTVNGVSAEGKKYSSPTEPVRN